MTGEALAAGFEALLVGMKVYPGVVPETPTYPYVLVVTAFPSVGGRAQSRSVQFRTLRPRTIVVGLTASSVRIIAQKVVDSLEGKRLVVKGWNVGAIESSPNEQPLLEDMDVTIPGTAAHPLYQPFDWVLTASQSR